MKKMTDEIYLAIVPFRTDEGIHCYLAVTEYIYQRPFNGPPQLCDSDVDYYGYEEIEFKVLDWRWRNSPWLLRKFSSQELDRANEEIHKFIEKRNQDEQTT